jgi:hypothetical protein
LFPDRPRFSLKVKHNGTTKHKRECEALGMQMLAKYQVMAVEGTLFDMKKEEVPVYRPKCWRIFGRYWYYRLKPSKKGLYEKASNTRKVIRQFGHLYWDELDVSAVERWARDAVENQQRTINTANTWMNFVKTAFKYNVEVAKPLRKQRYNILGVPCPVQGNHIPFSPLVGLKPLPGGNIRGYLLTPEQFEINYRWLKEHWPYFSTLYMACFLLGRRPVELSHWTWERIVPREIDGELYHCITIPPKNTKTDMPDYLPIPERLWQALIQQAGLFQTGYVFKNSDGNRLKKWWWIMDDLRKAFPGVDVGWLRDGRRGFITYQCDTKGEDRSSVKLISGHVTDSAFNRYCVGSLRTKLSITHKEKFKKRPDEGQNKDKKIA